jgi:hypothetical protein
MTTFQQRQQILGPEGGRCAQVWLYLESYQEQIGKPSLKRWFTLKLKALNNESIVY